MHDKRSTFPSYFPRRCHHRAPVPCYLSLVSFLSCLIFVDIIVVVISPLLSSFPLSYSALLLLHSSITIFFEQTNWLVRCQKLVRFFRQPASSIYFSISHKAFCVYPSYRTRYIDISTYHIHIYIDKSRFQANFKLSRVDRVRGS